MKSSFVPSDPTVARLLKRQTDYNRRVKEKLGVLQGQCEHAFQQINSWNDHDGWSWVQVTWYTVFRCGKCGFERTDTSTSKIPGIK